MTMENIEIEEEIEEIDYLPSTLMYRKKLIRKLSIIFVSLGLIFMTRFIVKYLPFDVVMESMVFKILLILVIILSVLIVLYLYQSKENLSEKNTNEKHKKILNVFDLIGIIPVFIAAISLSNAFIISPATVIGASMEPNYYEGEDILMWHLAPNYDRFDVVVLRTSNDEYYIKRIIGLPGETVIITNNEISINGVVIEQEFLENEFGSISVNTYCTNNAVDICTWDIPANSYFVLGDNREHSLDSRSSTLGVVDKDRLYGTVILKFNNILRSNND